LGVSLHDLIALTEETLVLKAGSWMKLDLVLGGIPFVAYGERERETNHVKRCDTICPQDHLTFGWLAGEALLGWRVVNVPEIGPETSTQSHAGSARRSLPHCLQHLRMASTLLC